MGSWGGTALQPNPKRSSKMATEILAATKIQAQWRRWHIEHTLQFDCERCYNTTNYTSCYQRDGQIRCYWCHKQHEEDKRYNAMSSWERYEYEEELRQQERMDEIAAERERCSACADLPNEYACCADCTRCHHCREKIAKKWLRKIPDEAEARYCESCYYEIMDDMARHEVCEDCGRGDCHGCQDRNGPTHYCGDEDCDWTCGVMECGSCIDKHKSGCSWYEYY